MDEIITIDQLRRELALKALNRAKCVAGAAELLGVSMRTVFRWKAEYGIERCPVTREYFLNEPAKIPSNAKIHDERQL